VNIYLHYDITYMSFQVIIYLVEHQLAPQAVCEALTLCEPAPKKH
jgi:hypothetical protein